MQALWRRVWIGGVVGVIATGAVASERVRIAVGAGCAGSAERSAARAHFVRKVVRWFGDHAPATEAIAVEACFAADPSLLAGRRLEGARTALGACLSAPPPGPEACATAREQLASVFETQREVPALGEGLQRAAAELAFFEWRRGEKGRAREWLRTAAAFHPQLRIVARREGDWDDPTSDDFAREAARVRPARGTDCEIVDLPAGATIDGFTFPPGRVSVASPRRYFLARRGEGEVASTTSIECTRGARLSVRWPPAGAARLAFPAGFSGAVVVAGDTELSLRWLTPGGEGDPLPLTKSVQFSAPSAGSGALPLDVGATLAIVERYLLASFAGGGEAPRPRAELPEASFWSRSGLWWAAGGAVLVGGLSWVILDPARRPDLRDGIPVDVR